MPKEVPKEATPHNQQPQNNTAVVTNTRELRSSQNKQNDSSSSVGTPTVDATQLFSPTGDTAAAAVSMVQMSTQGSGQQEEEERAKVRAFVAGAKRHHVTSASDAGAKSRSSERIQNKNEADQQQKKKKEDTKIDDKSVRENEVKLGEWSIYHAGVKNEELLQDQGIYIILMPDGSIKIGYVYKTKLGKRFQQLLNLVEGPVYYRFLKTGRAVTERGVKDMETMAHFALFCLETPSGKSRYKGRWGSRETFEADRSICDDILTKLRVYTQTTKFKVKLSRTGELPVTARAVKNQSHPKWIHFTYKTRKSQHTHPECPWKGETVGSTDYFNSWVEFARGQDLCKCMETKMAG